MKKSYLIILLILSLLVTGCTKTDEDCFTFEKGVITSYSDTCGLKVVIPKKIKGQEVKEIGNYAFMNMNLEKVKIPKTVKIIGIGSFAKNKLTKIKLPKNLEEIGANAFWDNQLKKIAIPKSVNKIGNKAFNDNNLKINNAFIYGYTNGKINKSILISYGGNVRNITIPSSVKILERESLANNSLVKVNLNKVEIIKSKALSDNLLQSLTIPKTVMRVDPMILMNNPIKTVTILGKKSFRDFGTNRSIDLVGTKLEAERDTPVKYIFEKGM